MDLLSFREPVQAMFWSTATASIIITTTTITIIATTTITSPTPTCHYHKSNSGICVTHDPVKYTVWRRKPSARRTATKYRITSITCFTGSHNAPAPSGGGFFLWVGGWYMMKMTRWQLHTFSPSTALQETVRREIVDCAGLGIVGRPEVMVTTCDTSLSLF